MALPAGEGRNDGGEMKICWMSNAPWAPTGYGNQTELFTPRLVAAGHEVAVSANYGLNGRVLNFEGVPVYPAGYSQNSHGQDVAAAHAARFGADIMISLYDIWPFNPEQLSLGGVKWVPWYPVDMEPLPPPVMRAAAGAYDRIVFSKFGERMTHQAGLDCRYVPHGVDTNIFKPMDKKAAREAMDFSQDSFLVGMVAANKGTPSRKAFAANIEAFARLKGKHNDAVLYLHSNKSENGEAGGINLPELCAFFGLEIGKDVHFADQYGLLLGYTPENMANLYNAMDVHLLVSMGEGFGIPIVEAQACGTPVIVGDWTAMSELCFGGWKVPKDEAERFWTPLGAYQFFPHVGAIEDALLEAYDKANKKDIKRDARVGALEYDADRVVERHWTPVLAEIERRIEYEVAA